MIKIQEVDLACVPYTGTVGRDIMELAVYITGQGWAILGKYPIPKSSMSGIFEIFSVKVCNRWNNFIILILCHIQIRRHVHGNHYIIL